MNSTLKTHTHTHAVYVSLLVHKAFLWLNSCRTPHTHTQDVNTLVHVFDPGLLGCAEDAAARFIPSQQRERSSDNTSSINHQQKTSQRAECHKLYVSDTYYQEHGTKVSKVSVLTHSHYSMLSMEQHTMLRTFCLHTHVCV